MIPVVRIALLDANVLFPFTLRDTLLRASAAGLFQVRWSDEILTETTRNLVAKGRATAAQAASLRAAMETAFPEAMVTGYQRRIREMPNDPKDRLVGVVRTQAAALQRPPRTADDIVRGLGTVVPVFAQQVGQKLHSEP